MWCDSDPFREQWTFPFWDEKDKMTHELLSFALATVPAGQPRPQADHS
jgi:hypothetical protein